MIISRISRYRQFKDFQKRILVATNLFGRGMDIERVNIVVNYDMPEDSDTYLHRVSFLMQLFSLTIISSYYILCEVHDKSEALIIELFTGLQFHFCFLGCTCR